MNKKKRREEVKMNKISLSTYPYNVFCIEDKNMWHEQIYKQRTYLRTDNNKPSSVFVCNSTGSDRLLFSSNLIKKNVKI